jgi:hypothetical protein
MARSMKAPKLGNQKKAVVLPLSTDLSDSPDFLVDGMVRLNLASGKIEYAINNVWRSMARVGTTLLQLQDTVGDGTTTDFVLDYTVATESDIIVFVGGVYQQPLISYTLSTSVGTSTITFTSPPPAPGSNPNRIVVIYNINSTDAD